MTLPHLRTAAVEPADDDRSAERIARLRRRVGWQVETAYGLAPAETPPEPEPEPELRPAAVERPLPTLPELARLVTEAAVREPELAEEWRWYLFYLRDFAAPDGSLDPTFRMLVETVFAPVLESAQS